MKRRALLGGLGAAGLTGLAGCLGLVGMDEHESSPAGVEPAAREETEYEQTAVEDIVVEEEVGISAYSETVSVTNYKTDHEKAVELRSELADVGRQRAAIFTVLTSPQIGVAGRNFNPVEEMSTTELIELVEENYDEIGDISREEDDEIEILGETTTRSRFSADATFNGYDLEVDVHVSEAVEAGDDLLVTIGVYPQHVRGGEEENVLSLMEAVDPDAADVDGDGDGDSDDSDDSDGEDGENDGDDESDSEGDGANDSDDDDGGDGPLGSVR